MDKKDVSIIICCAGMGTRLGIGSTKALVDIAGKPLIIRQLELLDDYDDIRLVVGYQAEKVIEVVNTYRKDIMYAFNYQYEHTGVADSLYHGALGARKYIVSIDGDVLANPEDFYQFMNTSNECICCCKNSSEEPVYMSVDAENKAIGFKKEPTESEWSGIAKFETKRLTKGKRQVFELLEELLPMPVVKIRAKDIDTPEDYDSAIQWYETGCGDL